MLIPIVPTTHLGRRVALLNFNLEFVIRSTTDSRRFERELVEGISLVSTTDNLAFDLIIFV